jgi:hypothetical protein
LAKGGGQMATEQYNFQIIRIHQIPGDAEST